MPTGLAIYTALKTAVHGLNPGHEFTINPSDANDLLKLNVRDLRSLHYAESVAEEVVSALNRGDISALAKTMGIGVLKTSHDVPPLLSEDEN